ncbi:MAG: CapA family protein [Firmicutes bacterium]|nr:CapA family protein [Bacillota bacterium]
MSQNDRELDEETLKRRAAIRKVQRRRKYTVKKFLNQCKAVVLAIMVLFLLSLLIFPGWTSNLKKGSAEVYASERGENPKMSGDPRDKAPDEKAETPKKTEPKEPVKPAEPEPEPEPQYETLSIRCIGDVMAHKSQVDGAYIKATGDYDFAGHLQYVAPYVGDADLSIANIETTFKGSGPYKGYPSFNAPDILAQNVADMGVDVGLLSNNHIMDQGLSVLERSIDHLRNCGMIVAGSQHDGEKRYVIMEIKGIKVGLVAYTYETPRNGGKRTINASVLTPAAEKVINSFTQDSYDVLDKDLAVIKQQMDACRADGAEIVILYMHWGEEYQKSGNAFQRYMGKAMAKAGADIIFGSHPHVPQEIDMVEVTDDAGNVVKTVPVFYSLGNFVSNQRTETLSNTYGANAAARTEQELIACVDITFCLDDKSFTIDRTSFIPLWVDREKKSDGTYNYGVIPLVEGFENNEMLVRTGHVSRARSALEAMTALIGEQYLNTAPYEEKKDEKGNALPETEVKVLPGFEYQRPAKTAEDTPAAGEITAAKP